MSKPHRSSITSNTYRFFVPPESLEGGRFALDDGDLAHQLGTVLRLRPGERVLLLDSQGWQYTVRLEELTRRSVAGAVEERAPAAGEPGVALVLYPALIRAERFEWLLQKGTELGAGAFVPLLSARSSAGDADGAARKRERWGRIVREAAEQSRRGRLPELGAPLPFAAACAQAAQHDLALLLWEGDGAEPLRRVLRARAGTPPQRIAILSGPEGGLTDEERTSAQAHGIIPVTLGPRTLRAETAPLAAAAMTLYELGEMGD
ncbi:MAG: 16S rRNA (uracil(1498)-N(3))-methyltransferase [Roseiflexaceae bacterium]